MKDANQKTAAEETAPAAKLERKAEKARMMRVFFGERDKWHGEPLYDAIVKKLRMIDVAGATVYRGILGYGAKGGTHRERFLHISEDLPVMVAVIDSEAKIAEAAAVVEGMMGDGLIAVSEVDVLRLVRSGQWVTRNRRSSWSYTWRKMTSATGSHSTSTLWRSAGS